MTSNDSLPERAPTRRVRAPLALVTLALLAIACPRKPTHTKVEVETTSGAAGATAKAAGPPGHGNHLILGLQQEPDKLNSPLNAMVYGTYINQCIYGYFVKYDETMQLVPDVITEIPTLENGGISADGLTYTYHLRPDVRWHDGKPFTSADVRFSAEAILDERHEVESRIGFDKVASIDTPDAHTVVFHLKELYVKFVADTFFDEGIMPAHLLASAVGPDFTSHPYHRAPVGLGPFEFESWTTGSHVTLVRNDDYFRGKVGIEKITFKFIPDTNNLLVALQAGEIDGYDNAQTSQHEQLKQLGWVIPHVTPQLMWEHVDMNAEDPILKDVRVRQAIQFAIDREEISKEVYGGLWPPAHGDVFPKLEWFNPEVDQLVRFDPDAARKLLDEAGWTEKGDGTRVKDGKKLELSISTTSGRQERELVEQVMQQQLRDVGIELTVQNHNATAFFAPYEQDGVLKKGRFQLAMYAWITSPDPDKWTLYHSSQIPPPAGQNHTRYRNERLDYLLDEGLRTLDHEKRKAMYFEVQRIVATEIPMTPLVWRADIDPMTTRLQNYKQNPTQTGDTWNAWEWRLVDP